MDGLVESFATLLERYGYSGALGLVKGELLPLAKSKDITLLAAAWEYADGDEDLDTSWAMLYYTLHGMDLGEGIPQHELESFDVKLSDR